MSDLVLTTADLQARIARKMWADPAFEAEFMADPKAAFEKYLERKLPADLKIHAHYNTANELHFVVPKRTEAALSDELSDEDLERVAGGETMLVVNLTIVAVTALMIATSVSQHVTQEEAGW